MLHCIFFEMKILNLNFHVKWQFDRASFHSSVVDFVLIGARKNGKQEFRGSSSDQIFDQRRQQREADLYQRLVNVYQDANPGHSTVVKWSAKFKLGWESLEGDPWSGRPSEVITLEMSQEVEKLVIVNRKISRKLLAASQNLASPIPPRRPSLPQIFWGL